MTIPSTASLVLAADWAFAHGHGNAVADIARVLRDRLPQRHDELDRVARLAPIDMLAASTCWTAIHDWLEGRSSE